MQSAPYAPAVEFAAPFRWGRKQDRLSAIAAALLLGLWTWHAMLSDNAAAPGANVAATQDTHAPETRRSQREHVVAGYGGAPYTHPSDVVFTKPGETDLTVHGVRWEGRPFKSPVYYGIRTLHWTGGGMFGGMLDFTHSKAITQRDQDIRLTGTRGSQNLTGRSRLGDVFRHFEFSHGHNTLTVNGLIRLPSLLPSLAPYVGLGAGVAVPHTEVHFQGQTERTYEYQYVGPAAQAVLGMELRLPHVTMFLEYKFTIASYEAPLTLRNGGWFPHDFWQQAADYWRQAVPAGGHLSTLLASHQVAAGMGVRITRAPARLEH